MDLTVILIKGVSRFRLRSRSTKRRKGRKTRRFIYINWVTKRGTDNRQREYLPRVKRGDRSPIIILKRKKKNEEVRKK